MSEASADSREQWREDGNEQEMGMVLPVAMCDRYICSTIACQGELLLGLRRCLHEAVCVSCGDINQEQEPARVEMDMQ